MIYDARLKPTTSSVVVGFGRARGRIDCPPWYASSEHLPEKIECHWARKAQTISTTRFPATRLLGYLQLADETNSVTAPS